MDSKNFTENYETLKKLQTFNYTGKSNHSLIPTKDQSFETTGTSK